MRTRWMTCGWLLLVSAGAAVQVEAGAAPGRQAIEAVYAASGAAEGQVPPISRLRLRITGRQTVEGRELVWWEFSALLAGDEPRYLGVRALSERAPMTGPDGIGHMERYLYRDAKGRVFEYVDTATGKALLPQYGFREIFLPRPAPDAQYEAGFASSGSLMGHVLMRIPRAREPQALTFDAPRVLRLRSDLIIAAQISERLDPPDQEPKDGQYKTRPFTREEYEALIAAGMNCFGIGSDQTDWLHEQPVFLRGRPDYPDSFYRSSYLAYHLYLDEPSVRMGWDGDLPHRTSGPEQVAHALRERVAAQILTHQQIELPPKVPMGAAELKVPPLVSWETEYFSAWYQFEGGIRGIVHEGRYDPHNHGWHPRDLFGAEGLDELRFQEQVHCLNAFLRGAARAFDGHWGVSVYPEGEPGLRQPALNMAYDMGARYIWFWMYGKRMDYDRVLTLVRGLSAHMSAHPRGPLAQVNRSARLGIALPRGYAFMWNGTWGMARDQISGGEATYGDISAALIWEGICASLRGEPFDFLIDTPGIEALGYQRLIRIHRDGSKQFDPPLERPRAARGLTLSLADDAAPDVSARMSPPEVDYTVPRVRAITIDGDLADWKDAQWIAMDTASHGFPDGITLRTSVINDVSREEWRMSFHHGLGMKWEQASAELEKKYQLEDLRDRGVVVTSVEPGSPAARADIREGDVIIHTEPWPINWSFQMYQRLGKYSKTSGGETIPFTLRRSGRYDFGAPGDLAAKVAFAVDDAHLYVAARVTDDQHVQEHFHREFWKGDSLQIGFDPTLERRDDFYGEEDQEFIFTLQDERPIVWRYFGRRGKELGENTAVQARIVRTGNQTLYEAAIPLSELAPMSPDLWPACGFNIVVNDNDGQPQRKGRLELRHRTMTGGKHPKGFATLRFEPSDDARKVSAAILWRRKATPEGGFFRVVLAACSPQAEEAVVTARLTSLDSPDTPAVEASLPLPLSPEPREHSLSIATQSPPGRYRLALAVRSRDGRVAAEDALPVYIHPRPPK